VYTTARCRCYALSRTLILIPAPVNLTALEGSATKICIYFNSVCFDMEGKKISGLHNTNALLVNLFVHYMIFRILESVKMYLLGFGAV
jgi:hypothetical protein